MAKILGDPALKQQWYGEVKTMADRIITMRTSLRSALEAAGAPGTWNHVTDQIGMFCFSGMTGEHVRTPAPPVFPSLGLMARSVSVSFYLME